MKRRDDGTAVEPLMCGALVGALIIAVVAMLLSGCSTVREVASDQAKLAVKEKLGARLEQKVSVEARQEFEATWDAGETEVALVDATIELVEPVLAEKAAKRIEKVDPARAAELRKSGLGAITNDIWGYVAAFAGTLGTVGVVIRWVVRKVRALRSVVVAVRNWARGNNANDLLDTIEAEAKARGVKPVLDAEVRALGAKVARST